MPNLNIPRLCKAAHWSYGQLRHYRDKYREAIKQYVGVHYLQNDNRDYIAINFMELAINIYTTNLVSQDPAALVTTEFGSIKHKAEDLRLALNKRIRQIMLGQQLERAVRDAMFCMGIMKVALETTSNMTDFDGYNLLRTEPFAQCIHLDDWVHDMNARDWNALQYCGHRYRIGYEAFKDSPLFDPAEVKKVRPSNREPETGATKDEPLESFSRGQSAENEDYEDTVELWDMCVGPVGQQRIVTLAGDLSSAPESGRPIREIAWEGPERGGGPYYQLGYATVPGNVVPYAPAQVWIDLHTLANRLFNKAGRQADRQKDITSFRGGSDEDAERLRKSRDGEVLRLDDPKSLTALKSGGVDAGTLAFILQLKDMFAYFGGNLDVLGGLSPQAPTLGQDRMLDENASKRMAEMQKRTVLFTRDVVSAIAYYMMTDPIIDEPVLKRVEGTSQEVMGRFNTDGIEEAGMDAFNTVIEPYSMVNRSPAEHLRAVTMVFQQFIAPFAEMMQAQGIGVNFEALLRLIARYANIPEINDFVVFMGNEVGGEGSGAQARGPAATTRTYERVNRPGATRTAKDDTMMRTLMGMASQPAEAANLTRAVG